MTFLKLGQLMRKRYPTDLSEDEWSKIANLFKTDSKKYGTGWFNKK